MKYQLNHSKIIMQILNAIVLGVVVGCILLVYASLKQQVQFLDCLRDISGELFNQYPKSDLFIYLLKKRSCILILFLLCTCITNFSISGKVIGFLWGVYYGYIASLQILQNGLYEMKQTLFLFFPHSLLYFIAILCIGFAFGINNTCCSYLECNKNTKVIQYFFKIFVIFLLCVLGLILEMKMLEFI